MTTGNNYVRETGQTVPDLFIDTENIDLLLSAIVYGMFK